VTTLWPGHSGDQTPAGTSGSFLQNVQTGSGAHTGFYSMGTWSLSPQGKSIGL